MAHLYSMTNLVRYEPYVESCTKQILKRFDQLADDKTVFNIQSWLQYYAFDLIGMITVSDVSKINLHRVLTIVVVQPTIRVFGRRQRSGRTHRSPRCVSEVRRKHWHLLRMASDTLKGSGLTTGQWNGLPGLFHTSATRSQVVSKPGQQGGQEYAGLLDEAP